MIKWIKTLFRIVAKYDDDLAKANRKIEQLDRLIREKTLVSAAIGFNKGENYIIAIGRYANTDYVEIFSTREHDFSSMCDQLHRMRKAGVVDRIDCPPNMRYVFNREFKG